jgi:hypothetical protein
MDEGDNITFVPQQYIAQRARGVYKNIVYQAFWWAPAVRGGIVPRKINLLKECLTRYLHEPTKSWHQEYPQA